MPWPETYEFRAVTGMGENDKFVYFLYYTNNFPIASTNNGLNYFFYYTLAGVEAKPNTLTYSPAAAQRVLRDEGRTLVMEWGHTIRRGQLLSTYLYLPDAWRLGSPQFAEVRITHGALFIASLASVYLMSWWVGMPVFGVAFVLLVGSDPFQLYEAYRHENVISWPITTLCFMLALALPFLTGKRVSTRYGVGAAVVAGLYFATVSQIRPEPVLVAVALTGAILTAGVLTRRTRLLLISLLLGAMLVGLGVWDTYFNRKFEQATHVVAESGGHVLSTPPIHTHLLWNSIWGGLGDFDTTHGYEMGDAAAATYAQPILKARYQQDLPWWWGVKGKENSERSADDYIDRAHLYYRIPYLEPRFAEVLREKVVGDILRDPLWYATILGRRVVRVLSETTTPQITLSTGATLRLPFSGWLVIPMILMACRYRRWAEVKILLFSGATSLTALLVYSDKGMTWYSVFHLCALALVASVAVHELPKVMGFGTRSTLN